MSDSSEPLPEDSGSSGTQIAVPPDDSQPPIEVLSPLAQAADGLAEDSSRSLGGQATARFVSGIIRQRDLELHDAKMRESALHAKLETYRSELESERVENAKLKALILSATTKTVLSNGFITIGCLLVGVATSVSLPEKISFALVAIGGATIVTGWVSSVKSGGR